LWNHIFICFKEICFMHYEVDQEQKQNPPWLAPWFTQHVIFRHWTCVWC
jgi:hypothetical protein